MTNVTREEWNNIKTNGDREKVQEVDPKEVKSEEQKKFGIQIFLLILTLGFLVLGLCGNEGGQTLFGVCLGVKIFYRIGMFFSKYGERIREAVKGFFTSVFFIGILILYFVLMFRIGAWIYAGVGGGVLGVLALLRFFGR